MEQELPTLPEHLNSPPVYIGVRVTCSLALCVCFVDRCLSFFFGHCVVCPFIYGFWLPLWYLQALLGIILYGRNHELVDCYEMSIAQIRIYLFFYVDFSFLYHQNWPWVTQLMFYTDISCLGGVFFANTPPKHGISV